MNHHELLLTDNDHRLLSVLLEKADRNTADLLEEELSRATIVGTQDIPGDVVRMNSFVCFVDIKTGKKTEVHLVHPDRADLERNQISVLSPIGSALIGLRKGQSINWPLPNGYSKTIKVLTVKNDPVEEGYV